MHARAGLLVASPMEDFQPRDRNLLLSVFSTIPFLLLGCQQQKYVCLVRPPHLGRR